MYTDYIYIYIYIHTHIYQGAVLGSTGLGIFCFRASGRAVGGLNNYGIGARVHHSAISPKKEC